MSEPVAPPERILYAYDPLCGWCYGFIPVMRAVRDAYPDTPIDVRMGGLVTGDRVSPYSDARAYIEDAAKRMGEVTGRPLSRRFFDELLSRADVISNSAQPCAAVLHVREQAPDLELEFAHALQEAHFEEAMSYDDAATYRTVMDRLGIDAPDPDIATDGEGVRAAEQEFADTRALGIGSYPTVLVVRDKRLAPVPLTYDPKEFLGALAKPAQDLRYGLPAGSPDV